MMKMKHSVLLGTLLTLSMLLQAQYQPYPIDTIRGTAVYRYPVEKSIGLYRISVNFGVSQSDIIAWNPQLESRGLRFGETILIPVTQQPREQQPREQQPTEQQPTDNAILTLVQSALAQEDTISNHAGPVFNDSNVIRIGLLLPLYANALERDKNMDRFYDFYAGSLLAVYQAQAQGQSIEVYTYDIEKNDARLMQILEDTMLSHLGMLIGPAYAPQVATVSTWAQEHQIPMLIPFQNHVPGIEDNPMLWQFNASEQVEAEILADSIAAIQPGVRCIVIESEPENIPLSIQHLRQALADRNVDCQMTTLHTILTDSLQQVLNDSVENIMIFNTERYTGIQPLLPHLQPLMGTYRITLYSHYSWQKENMVIPQIYSTMFTPASPEQTQTYNELFDRYFHHHLASTQPRFDQLGYDLMGYAIQHLQDSTRIDSTYQGLQSNIHFTRVSENGGYMNQHIHIIHQ